MVPFRDNAACRGEGRMMDRLPVLSENSKRRYPYMRGKRMMVDLSCHTKDRTGEPYR